MFGFGNWKIIKNKNLQDSHYEIHITFNFYLLCLKEHRPFITLTGAASIAARSIRIACSIVGSISMTEEDHCAENAQAERVNGIEYYLDVVFNKTEQARKAVKMAINMYNQQRPHLSLNYQLPEMVHRGSLT
ncbi:MAG: integrase core domain-containing protein [Balneolaceae bacterium]